MTYYEERIRLYKKLIENAIDIKENLEMLLMIMEEYYKKKYEPKYIVKGLTNREVEVFDCLMEGMGNKEIATYLGIGINTVKKYVSNVYAKSSVFNKSQLIIKYKTKEY